MSQVDNNFQSLGCLREFIANNNLKDDVDWERIDSRAKIVIEKAMAGDDEGAANEAWFLSRLLSVIQIYIECFGLMKNCRYYDSWCALERVEIDLLSLCRNPFLDINELGVRDLSLLVENFQSIFPYKHFFSPEFLNTEVVCSICDRIVDPWSECSHRPGVVYHGKECINIVKKTSIIGFALVKNPVQKYSVPMRSDGDGNTVDHYDYSALKFVVDRLCSPFSKWSSRWTNVIQPHKFFSHVGENQPCPCESDKLYGECCLQKDGVLRPHLDIIFDEPPPEHLPNGQLVGFGEHSGMVNFRD